MTVLRPTLNRALDWLATTPWIYQLFVGLIWIYLAIVCLGKHEVFGIFVAFYGMLTWAISEKDNREYQKLLDDALRISKQLLKIAEGKS